MPNTQNNIYKPSSTLPELTALKFSVCCTNNPSFTTQTVLQEFLTRIPLKSSTNTVIDLHANNNDQHPNMKEHNHTALTPTFLQEWNDFYNKFVSLTSYVPMSNINASLSVDDDNGQLMCYCNNTPQPTLDDSNASLKQLHHVIGKMAKPFPFVSAP